MSNLDLYLAEVAERARRGAIRLTVHRLKYGYEPRWDLGPDGEARILDCSLPFGKCPPTYLPVGDNLIARALQEAREEPTP